MDDRERLRIIIKEKLRNISAKDLLFIKAALDIVNEKKAKEKAEKKSPSE